MNIEIIERLVDKSIQGKNKALPDLLRHSKVAHKVVSVLNEASKIDESPCIAVFGPWGTGKTGILNLVGHQLNSDRYVWHHVDAWHNQRDDLLVLEILRVLFENAGPNFKEVLLRLLWAFSGNVTSLITNFIPGGVSAEEIAHAVQSAYPKGFPASREQLIKAEFTKLVNALTSNGDKRLVIAIDNLDRCRPEAALRVLETLYLVTDVPNCAFIVAADQQVLVSFLNREYRGTDFNGTKYLEKVFPYYFRVPDPWVAWKFEEVKQEQDEIFALLEFLIDEKNPWRSNQEIFKMLWHYCSQPRALRNPRRIKRILRRILEYNLENDKLRGVTQTQFAQNILFLVIISDIWPEVYEFYMTTDHASWRAWLDYMSNPKGTPEPKWILADNQELQIFLYEVRKYNSGTFDNTVIGNQKDLASYLRELSKLGL